MYLNDCTDQDHESVGFYDTSLQPSPEIERAQLHAKLCNSLKLEGRTEPEWDRQSQHQRVSNCIVFIVLLASLKHSHKIWHWPANCSIPTAVSSLLLTFAGAGCKSWRELRQYIPSQRAALAM
ncbi:MAG: hypothetical protein LAO22_02795 [Acidobacteriia bacterium]|nr:hypothetical protein [Terriglobia bacterium]